MAGGEIILRKENAHDTPGSGYSKLIVKLDGSWYTIDDDGTQTPVGLAAHASMHEDGGSDEINVGGLSGILADPQTPTGHNASHQGGGGDAIKLDDLADPDDNTDLDASTSKHGLMQKYPGGTTDFLRADGSFAAPSGGGQTNTVSGSNGITNVGDDVDADLRPTYGALSNTVCEGNDSRLSDARTPTAHAFSHSDGNSDEIEVESLATSEADTNKRLAPDGSGGLQFLPSSDAPENFWFEHFITSNTDQDEIGTHGWDFQTGGTGPSISVITEAGHPGIIQMEAGTASAARGSLYMGDAVMAHCILNALQNDLDLEFLVKFKNSIGADDLERFTCGFGDQWNTGTGSVQHNNGVYVDIIGGATPVFRITTANGGTRTTQSGTTAIALDVWYRIGIRMTYPGGMPTASLLVNGAVEGNSITANIPAIGVAIGLKADAGDAVVDEMAYWVDWVRLKQVTYQED